MMTGGGGWFKRGGGLTVRWSSISLTVSPNIPAPLYLPALYADVAVHHPDAAVLSGKQTNQEV
jgi:hypothetical protein